MILSCFAITAALAHDADARQNAGAAPAAHSDIAAAGDEPADCDASPIITAR
jgi:hypothetical protein